MSLQVKLFITKSTIQNKLLKLFTTTIEIKVLIKIILLPIMIKLKIIKLNYYHTLFAFHSTKEKMSLKYFQLGPTSEKQCFTKTQNEND